MHLYSGILISLLVIKLPPNNNIHEVKVKNIYFKNFSWFNALHLKNYQSTLLKCLTNFRLLLKTVTHTHKHTAHVHQHLYQNYVDDQISNSLCKINSNIKLTRVKKKRQCPDSMQLSIAFLYSYLFNERYKALSS